MRLWLHLYECVFMTSLVTSPGHRAGQILTLVYPRQYLTYSVNQKLKMSEMLMAIIWVNSISGMNSGKKILRAQNGGHLKILKYQKQLQLDLRYETIVPNCAKNYFSWWRHRWCHRMSSKFHSIVLFWSFAPGASCKGDVSSIAANMVIVFLGYTCQKTISIDNTFQDCRSKVNVTCLLGDIDS